MIREYGPDEAEDIPGLSAILRAYLRDGPETYIDNARVEMRMLEVDGSMCPLVFADPGTSNTDVCSPHSHYILYTCEETIKRNPRVPAWVFKGVFIMWSLLAPKKWLDRVLYVNNWLFSTNPEARLSADQIKAVTGFLRQRYPDRVIIFKSINPNLNSRLAEDLRRSGYRLIPARTVYLLDPLPPKLSAWKENTQRDIAQLNKGRLRIAGLQELQPGSASRLEKLYRGLYLDKHSQLNQQFNSHFFELALSGEELEGIFLKDGERIVAMTLFHEDGGVLLAQLLGYDLDYSRKAGLYRQVVASLMLEAQSRGLILNLSAGAGSFKTHRGAIATLEYDAVLASGLPFYQQLAWKLVAAQSSAWSWRLRSHAGSVKDLGGDLDGWQESVRQYHGSGRQQLWRRCSDAFYEKLLKRLLVPGKSRRMLKTDLWDEMYGGGLLPFLKTRASEVLSVDVALDTVRIARQSQPELAAVTGDIRRLPFAANSFDLVVSNSTLDHFEEKKSLLRALAELARVLEPGGRLLISLDNPSNPIIRLRMLLPTRWLMRLGIVPYYVGVTLSAKQLCKVLENEGFQVELLEAAGHSPRVLMVGLAAMLQRWAPLRWQDWFVAFQHHFEVLSRWPTRFLTGHYIVVRALKE